MALKIVLEDERNKAIAVSLTTLAKRVAAIVPFNIIEIKKYIKETLPKEKITTLYGRRGPVEIVKLYDIEELILKYWKDQVPLKAFDDELDY